MDDMDALLNNWGAFMRDFDPRLSYPDKASPHQMVHEPDDFLGWGSDEDGAGKRQERYDWISAGVLDNWLRKLREQQERHFDVLRRYYYHRKRKHISASELGEAQRALLDIYQPHKSPDMTVRVSTWVLDYGDNEAA